MADQLRPAEQAVGADDQDDGHDEEHHHQRRLRQQQDAPGLQLADQHGRQEGAGDAAHAADDHDHEGAGEDGEVHEQVGAALGQLQGTAEPGEEGAQEEDAGEQPGLVDAQRPHHLAVGGGGAHQDAEAGPVQEQPEEAEDDGAGRDQHQVVARQRLAQDHHGTPEIGRARSQLVLRAPAPERQVLDHQDDAEGGDQLEELGRAVDAAEDEDLDERADDAHDQCRAEQRQPERAVAAAEPVAEEADEGQAEIGAQHVERAVREIDHARDAEDQRQAGRDQEQAGSTGEAGQDLDEKEAQRGLSFAAINTCAPAVRAAAGARHHQSDAGRSSFTIASGGR